MPTIESLKKDHDRYATIAHVFSSRFQWYHEEFEGVKDIIDFCRMHTKELSDQIDYLEPKKEDPK
jgi:hypothetical protein